MFDRKKYKNFAKQQLKGRWTVPVLMTLIVTVINILFVLPEFLKIINSDAFWFYVNNPAPTESDITDLMTTFNSSTPFLVSIIKVIVAGIFEVATLNVYFKMSLSPEPVTFSHFLEGMNSWAKAALAALWQMLWTMVWSFLFVIPGIIKSISYSQMFFIISENKTVSVQKSMKISMIITRGHKMDLFIMYLSFIGWGIIANLTMGIGNLFLTPYIKMSTLNAYHAMLQEAIEKGHIRLEDLSE